MTRIQSRQLTDLDDARFGDLAVLAVCLLLRRFVKQIGVFSQQLDAADICHRPIDDHRPPEPSYKQTDDYMTEQTTPKTGRSHKETKQNNACLDEK